MELTDEFVLLPCTDGVPCEESTSIARHFSVISIALFLFLATLWIGIAPALASPLQSVTAVVGSLAALLAGTILSIVGIACRKDPQSNRSMAAGLIGLGLNGLCLLVLPVLVLVGALSAKASIPVSQQTLGQNIPAVATTQPVEDPQPTINVVQTNIHLTVKIIPAPAPAPTVVYVHHNTPRPMYPVFVHVPCFIPQPHIVMVPTPGIRHY
jgi:hypothetical protein